MADKSLLRQEPLRTSGVAKTFNILQVLEELGIQPFYEGLYKRMTVYESSRSCIIRNRWWILGLVLLGCFALIAIWPFIPENLQGVMGGILMLTLIVSLILFFMFAEDDPLGEWKKISLDKYQETIPPSVLETVKNIENRLPNAEFHIEYFSSGLSQRKCFLIFSYDREGCCTEFSGQYHIEFWEESQPEFEAATANCSA